jgi:hypothetical protein
MIVPAKISAFIPPPPRQTMGKLPCWPNAAADAIERRPTANPGDTNLFI